MMESEKTVLNEYLKNEKAYKVDGNEIILGRYPQSVVLDDLLIQKLDALTITNANGYYEYDGKEYAKAEADPHVDDGYKTTRSNDNRFTDNKTYITVGKTYYFLVEEVRWIILEEKSDEYFLLTKYLLDKHPFHSDLDVRIKEDKDLNSDSENLNIRKQTFKDFNDKSLEDKKIYPNNYEYSDIRKWLNNDFYNKVFNDEEKKLIKETLVDNSAKTTSSIYNEYACNDTIDKLFMLSYQDIKKETYGFEKTKGHFMTRLSTITDYARAIGCSFYTTYGNSVPFGGGFWWSRSPDDFSYDNVEYMHQDDFFHFDRANREDTGVRPVMRIHK